MRLHRNFPRDQNVNASIPAMLVSSGPSFPRLPSLSQWHVGSAFCRASGSCAQDGGLRQQPPPVSVCGLQQPRVHLPMHDPSTRSRFRQSHERRRPLPRLVWSPSSIRPTSPAHSKGEGCQRLAWIQPPRTVGPHVGKQVLHGEVGAIAIEQAHQFKRLPRLQANSMPSALPI